MEMMRILGLLAAQKIRLEGIFGELRLCPRKFSITDIQH